MKQHLDRMAETARDMDNLIALAEGITRRLHQDIRDTSDALAGQQRLFEERAAAAAQSAPNGIDAHTRVSAAALIEQIKIDAGQGGLIARGEIWKACRELRVLLGIGE